MHLPPATQFLLLLCASAATAAVISKRDIIYHDSTYDGCGKATTPEAGTVVCRQNHV
jgi:ethanolamine utilization microcompartment shell protein EutL